MYLGAVEVLRLPVQLPFATRKLAAARLEWYSARLIPPIHQWRPGG